MVGENTETLTSSSVPSAEPVRELAAQVKPVARGDRWDWVIASFCISAGVIGLRTVNDPILWSQLANGVAGSETIGRLTKKNGGVRFRPSVSLLWHDVYSSSENVAAGDTVFTSSDGQAELRLNDGSVAEIEPNSLIVVQRSSDVVLEPQGWFTGKVGAFFAAAKPQSVLRIESGSARVNMRKDARPIKLQVRGRVYNLTSHNRGQEGSAEISVDKTGGFDGAARIASLSGASMDLSEATSTGESASVQLAQGQQGVIAETLSAKNKIEIQNVKVKLLSPVSGARVVLPADAPVSFAWKQVGALDASASQAELEISPDGKEGGDKKTIAADTSAQSARVALGQGGYRWRLVVHSKGDSRVETPWQSFSLARLAPPQAIGPIEAAGFTIPSGQDRLPVSFSWHRPAEGLSSELEWTSGGASHRELVDASEYQASLAPGEYQWRLRAQSSQGEQISEWSKTMRFTVRTETQSKTTLPGESSSVLVTPSVEIAAPPIVPAAVAPPAVTPPVVAKAASIARPLPPPVARRKPVRTLSVTHGSGSTRLGVADRLDQLVVPLRWQPLEDAKQYEVIVNNDTTHKQLLDKITKLPALQFILDSVESTRFSYQVTAITSEGEKIRSAPVPIEIELSAPVLKTPRDGTRLTTSRQASVLVTWERTVLTESYLVQFSEDPTFKRNVREETALRNLLSVRGLKLGVPCYWRVQALAHGHKSVWSAASMFVPGEQ